LKLAICREYCQRSRTMAKDNSHGFLVLDEHSTSTCSNTHCPSVFVGLTYALALALAFGLLACLLVVTVVARDHVRELRFDLLLSLASPSHSRYNTFTAPTSSAPSSPSYTSRTRARDVWFLLVVAMLLVPFGWIDSAFWRNYIDFFFKR
jgi:hypothetical protein